MKAQFFIFSLLVLISCTEGNSFNSFATLKDGIVQINIDDLKFEKSIVIDSIFKIEKIVKLESNGDFYYGFKYYLFNIRF